MKEDQLKNTSWSFKSKTVFKFVFTYFVLFILLMFAAPLLEEVLRWFAEHVLNWGTDFKTDSTGSGDRSYDYVRFGFTLFSTFIIGLIWTIFNREPKFYNKFYYWFEVLLRAFLFATMILYGMAKVFKGQFPSPNLEQLLQPIGEMSPMGLAWTFMGYSMAYNIFLGIIEVLGGLLLLNRKTVTLGSIIVVGVMLNVVMMNFTYDIPVKLFSIHLLLMALILLVRDRNRIVNMFLKNELVKPRVQFTPALNTTLKKIIFVGKILVSSIAIIAIVLQCFIGFEARDQLKEKSEFYGIWEAQLFIKNNDTLAPLLTDTYQWRYLIVDYKKKAAVKKMNDSIDKYSFRFNPQSKRIIFNNEIDSTSYHFSYAFINQEELRLKGSMNGDSLSIKFRRKPKSDFRLINRGFHWVNEKTYNY